MSIFDMTHDAARAAGRRGKSRGLTGYSKGGSMATTTSSSIRGVHRDVYLFDDGTIGLYNEGWDKSQSVRAKFVCTEKELAESLKQFLEPEDGRCTYE